MTESIDAAGPQFALGDLSGLGDGELRAFPDVGPVGIVVFRVAGALHALDDRCSHAQVRLSEGRLRRHSIICPMHGAQFDVRDGAHGGPPATCPVASHPVTEVDGIASVRLAASDIH